MKALASHLNLIANCAFGLESSVKWELKNLGFDPKILQPGRVGFEGSWHDICRCNIWLRIADRVQIVIAQYEAKDFDQLFETVKAIDWTDWLPQDAKFPVRGRSHKSQLSSVPAIQRSVKRAIVESLFANYQTESLPETGVEYRLEISLLNDVATLTLDTTGDSLHKRGYRRLVGQAPIKETLAAAMIQLSVWRAERPLIDPFCGTGTIPIEAARIALNMAPGLERNFSSSYWPQIQQEVWTNIRDEARKQIRTDIELQIIGTDIDTEALRLARLHAEAAGVLDHVHFQEMSFAYLRSKRRHGCVITNPPYGERLSDNEQLLPLYESMPGVLQRLPTWSFFIITSMPKFESIIQKNATRRRKLFNGRIECTYYQFLGPKPNGNENQYSEDANPDAAVLDPLPPSIENQPQTLEKTNDSGTINTPDRQVHIPNPETPIDIDSSIERRVTNTLTDNETFCQDSNPGSSEKSSSSPGKPKIVDSVFRTIGEKDHHQAELFASRIVKRAKHLRRWPAKRGITCFRLYERDIPELPFVVDRYDDSLHITEYDRPHDRNLAHHAAWLELMCKTAAKTLDIPIQQVFFKSRQRIKGKDQYQKVGQQGQLKTVQEDGLDFLVNLNDYVDTGLFLDHRNTRKMVRGEANDNDFLNLFAYTGSFTVYAAAGGAKSTTTVDWSNTYLDWAKKNMVKNGFITEGQTNRKHQFEAVDSIEFLKVASAQGRKWDLAVVDPPTFSNSKRTDKDWDVQTCHVELLNSLANCIRPKGIVFFSTNFRRFKLDETVIPSFEFLEISKQTVPDDFRNKRIHRCWRLTKS